MTVEERAEFIVEAILARLMLSHTTIDEAGQATGKLQQMVIDTIRAAVLEERLDIIGMLIKAIGEGCLPGGDELLDGDTEWVLEEVIAAIRSRGEQEG